MNKKWKTRTLGSLCNFVRGPFGGSLKKSCFKTSGYAVYEQQHAIYDQFEDIRYFIDESKYLEMSRFELSPGDLIMSCSGTMGKVAIVPNDIPKGIINQALLKLSPGQNVISEFLKYWMNSPNFQNQLIKFSQGVAIKNVASVKILKEIEISLPVVLEQKRIVSIVDEVFEGIDRAIANTEKNLTNTRELFESYLNEIFTKKGDGWEEKTLREVSSDFGRGKSKHRPRNDPRLYGNSYPFIQTGDVRNCNHFITQNSQFYSEVGLAQSKLWSKGTICITIAANIAETGILGFDACFPDSIIGIVVNDEITSNDFVEYLLQSVKARIKAKGQGSAQDNINLATFENERFPFPSLEQQKLLVSRLNKLSSETRHLEAIYRLKIAALNELKQSILQKAFTGELTAGTANQAIEAAEEDRHISKDCLHTAETAKQNVHQSGQLSIWA
jgi:type I restriction enzyme, S subunit